MNSVQLLAERARGLAQGDQIEAALAQVRGSKRWEVEAAYSYARRRELDADWRAAADLLELAVAGRKAWAFGPPRWCQRAELHYGILVVWGLVEIALILPTHSWGNLPTVLLALVFPLAYVYSVRRSGTDHLRASSRAGRIPTLVKAIVEASRRTDAASCPVDEVAGRLQMLALRDNTALSRHIAVLALAEAGRNLAAGIAVDRKARLKSIDLARRRLLAYL